MKLFKKILLEPAFICLEVKTQFTNKKKKIEF